MSSSLHATRRGLESSFTPRRGQFWLCFFIGAMFARSGPVQAQAQAQNAASPTDPSAPGRVAAPALQRCLHAAPAGREGALTAQTCLIESGVSDGDKLILTLRGLYPERSSPPRLRLFSGQQEPLSEPLTAQVVAEKSPIDVVAVVMMARSNQQQGDDASAAVRAGLSELVSATYAVPGSRFGLLGYAHDKSHFSPQLLDANQALLGESQKADVLAKLNELKITETAETKWVASNAMARGMALLAESASARPQRRRLLVLLSNGVDSDLEGSQQMLELAASQARSLNIGVLYVPPLGHRRQLAPQWKKLVESSGGSFYPNSKTPEELQAHFGHLSEWLNKSLRIETALPGLTTAGPDSELLLLDLADEKSDPARQLIRFARPRARDEYAGGAGGSELAASNRAAPGSPLMTAFGLVSMLGAAMLLLRWQAQRIGSEALGPPTVAISGSCCAWLHWVERGRDIPLTRLPHRIGNDLDCDTITLGVGGKKTRAVLLAGDNPSAYFLQSLDPDGVQDSEQRGQRSILLQDGMEFFINQQRFKLFVTQLAAPERGV